MSAGQEGGFKTIFSYHSGVKSISRLIITLRREKRLNSREITEELNRSNISISVRTVEAIF